MNQNNVVFDENCRRFASRKWVMIIIGILVIAASILMYNPDARDFVALHLGQMDEIEVDSGKIMFRNTTPDHAVKVFNVLKEWGFEGDLILVKRGRLNYLKIVVVDTNLFDSSCFGFLEKLGSSFMARSISNAIDGEPVVLQVCDSFGLNTKTITTAF